MPIPLSTPSSWIRLGGVPSEVEVRRKCVSVLAKKLLCVEHMRAGLGKFQLIIESP